MGMAGVPMQGMGFMGGFGAPYMMGNFMPSMYSGQMGQGSQHGGKGKPKGGPKDKKDARKDRGRGGRDPRAPKQGKERRGDAKQGTSGAKKPLEKNAPQLSNAQQFPPLPPTTSGYAKPFTAYSRDELLAIISKVS